MRTRLASPSIGLLAILVWIGLVGSPVGPAAAEPPDTAEQTGTAGSVSKEYRAAVKAFLELANSTLMGEQIAYLMAEQTLASIAAAGTPVTDPMRDIVLDEAMKEFEPTFGDIEYLTDLHAPLYKQHFTEEEIRELIAFYETPLGRKVTEALPRISQASGLALQQASYARVPAFQTKVDARLRAAGIELGP